MKSDTHKKSILKSIGWRIIGVITLTTVTYIFTRNWIQVALITIIHHAIFLFIYYLHERLWLKIKWQSKLRPMLKAVTYEIILGNLVLGSLTWIITGSWLIVTLITLIYISIRFITYPVFEYFCAHQKIVYAYMVGDIIHAGHLKHLKIAKKQGDYLIVGVLTDQATMEKKPKPTLRYFERVEVIRAIKYVDEVVPQLTYSPLDNVKKIEPDVLMESTSHKEMPANKFVESYGGEVYINPYWPGQSTTKIKNRIKNLKVDPN